ncbi:FAD-dependent monooxygenase [Phaeobacter sp. HF9A]|uniref:FAD-dependent monooxygenase n=1 Tax=Phaeobacter sp. HF9A TaxID=2721561 RepID=UPI00142FD396|nr:TIGR03862 family flavoprotein [Phaeobacter sp. HF9A]NIZ12982.1 TIGR03862 family flavoprotein [Phaeobacter sp. HF9A]
MNETDAVVIGGGPAGLMAAAQIAEAGHRVMLIEAKPSPARKFLMAGKSGLNLTKDEPVDALLAHYGQAQDWLSPMIRAFDAQAVQAWARGLGQELFTGSTGRVFPTVMKGSPLLRSWLAELDARGVSRQMGWRWAGWQEDGLLFKTPDGPQVVQARATVLALGGASWARLGSDGTWAAILAARGVALAPFQPSNAALSVGGGRKMAPHFGEPIKSVAWRAGAYQGRGEATLSARGLEGGGIYPLTPALREGHPLVVDLLPDLSEADLAARLAKPRGKQSWASHLRRATKLSTVKLALLQEFGRPLPQEAKPLAQLIKSLPVRHAGLCPLDEAISTAGGVRRDAMDEGLMLTALPGIFCAGEMLDWEAPTGGYLLTACLATGRWAGQAAARYLA